MKKRARNRILALAAALIIIATGVMSVFAYGKEYATAGVTPDRSSVKEMPAAAEPEVSSEPEVLVPESEADPVPVITADMSLPLLTESGFYPEQLAAAEFAAYEQEHLQEVPVAPSPVFVSRPAPEPAPGQPAPQPAAPVLMDNQQEGCVGDGLTY